METEQKLDLLKSIYEEILHAWELGYYDEWELDHDSINFAEIREWCGLKDIQPEDSDYTSEDKWIDNLIKEIYEQIKKQIKTILNHDTN